MYRILLVTVIWMNLLSAGSAELVRKVVWKDLAAKDGLAGGVVETTGADAGHLKVAHSEEAKITVPLVTLSKPGITELKYILKGRIKYQDVQGKSYLEMWSHFSEDRSFFSRTMGDRGAMGVLTGNSDWRYFILPFNNSSDMPGPEKLVVNLVLEGSGTVWFSDLELNQFEQGGGGALPGAWWSNRTGAWLGAILGSVFGMVFGCMGWCSARGKFRGLVVFMLYGTIVFGVVTLACGLVALRADQPREVTMILLLLGALFTLIPIFQRTMILRQYETNEMRRMRALDAGTSASP